MSLVVVVVGHDPNEGGKGAVWGQTVWALVVRRGPNPNTDVPFRLGRAPCKRSYLMKGNVFVVEVQYSE